MPPSASSTTARVEDVPRANISDLQTISDNPNLSILHITGDRKGYGKYRGIPFVVRSEFHISAKEYKQRENFDWPDDNLPGMMVGNTTSPDSGPSDTGAEVDFSDLHPEEPPSWGKELFE